MTTGEGLISSDCAHRPGATEGEGYRSVIAYSFLALFGPAPQVLKLSPRRESCWLSWQIDGKEHGLQKFAINESGLVDPLPVAASFERKPPKEKRAWISQRQWQGRNSKIKDNTSQARRDPRATVEAIREEKILMLAAQVYRSKLGNTKEY